MSVLSVTDPETGIELQLDMPSGSELSPELIETVVNGARTEDLRAVDPTELSNSYSVLSAYINDHGGRYLAGSVRQRQRHYLETDFDTSKLCVNELATLYVDPKYRNRGVANSLIKFAAKTMDLVSLIPVAVCNKAGQKVFEGQGFEPIGVMPGGERIVEIFPPKLDWFLAEQWEQGLREELTASISRIPRFAGMVILEASPE